MTTGNFTLTLQDRYYIYLMQFINLPYKWAGNHPLEGMDCGGAVIFWLKYLGIEIPRDMTAQSLHDYLIRQPDTIHGHTVKKGLGCLAFFGKGKHGITHVDMCIDGFRVIGMHSGGPTTVTVEDAIEQGAMCKVRMLDYRRNLVSIVQPKLPWTK